MIRIDFGESADGPTLWVIIDKPQDFAPFRHLILSLSEGTLENIRTRTRPELFLLWPHIADLEMTVVRQFGRDGVTVLGDKKNWKLTWKLSREAWTDVLDKIDALNSDPPNGHQYFDYRNATVIVSFMEKLRDVPFPSSQSASELQQ